MNWLETAAKEILDGAIKAMNELDMDSVEKMIHMITEARDMKIFVLGMGRSGFVEQTFALRLMSNSLTFTFQAKRSLQPLEKTV